MGAALAVLGLGVAFLLVAWALGLRTRRFLERSVEATATVTGFRRTYVEQSGEAFKTVVSFEVGPQVVEVVDGVATRTRAHQVGDEVSVRYDPGDPTSARLASTDRLWFYPRVLAGVGVGFVVLAAVSAALA